MTGPGGTCLARTGCAAARKADNGTLRAGFLLATVESDSPAAGRASAARGEFRGALVGAALGSEIVVEPDDGNGLEYASAAQCQHVRAVSIARVDRVRGNVGAVALSQIRDIIGLILDTPS
ncbi:MAG: hypothetical protein U9N84_11445 [Actinomycetota bacterium]|nr:hypothetical protein [Actinomycetota bacterium]